MFNLFKNIFKILSKDDKKRFYFLCIITLFAALFETLSLGSFIPLIEQFSKVEMTPTLKIVNNFYDTSNLSGKESLKFLDANGCRPDSKTIIADHFGIVFDTVGLEATRHQAIKSIKPGGVIIHVGLSQPSGTFNFRKATLQEITFIGTYCYTNKDFEKTLNILNEKQIGSLDWIEYRNLRDGSSAFKEIHEGSCVSPKIILLVNS